MKKIIRHQNLPYNFTWVLWLWVAALTVEVYGFDSGWYYAIATFGIFLLVGLVSLSSKSRQVDIFAEDESAKRS